MKKKSTIFGNFGKLTASALINKTLGYVRDAMVVWIFGACQLTDAYYVVLRFITFFRRSIGEGAVNAALLPEFFTTRGSQRDINAFFSSLLAFSALISFLLCALVIIFRKSVIAAVAGGFMGDSKQFGIAETILAIMAMHIVFLSVYAVFQSFLNFKNIFFKPAISQTFFSLMIMAALVILRKSEPEKAIYAVSFTAMISGFFQILFLVKDIKKAGLFLKFANPLRPGLPIIFIKASAAAICLSQDYILLFISMIFGSFMREGTVTAFYNSSRLMQFPLSLIAASVSMAALRETSSAYSVEDKETAKKNFSGAFRLNLAVLLPAAIGLALLAGPISEFLFMHGKFSTEDAIYTAQIIRILAIAIPFLGLNKLFISLLSAAGRQLESFRIILVSVILHASLSWLLSDMGAAGTAYSAAGVSALSFVVFSSFSSRHCGTHLTEEFRFFLKILASSLVMSTTAFCMLKLFGAAAARVVILIIAVSAAAYFGCLKIFRINIRSLED